MADGTKAPRIRVGEDYCRRDESGSLIETGWIDPEDGHEHPHVKNGKPFIDASSPAATVPFDQAWT